MIHSASLALGALCLFCNITLLNSDWPVSYKIRKEALYPLQSNKPKILPHYKAECDCTALLRFIPLWYTLSFPF